MSFSFAYPAWLNNLDKAKAIATQSNKLILVSLSNASETNGNDRSASKLFNNPCFISYAVHNLVLVKGDSTLNLGLDNDPLRSTSTINNPLSSIILMNNTGKILKQWSAIEALTPEGFVSQIIESSYEFKQGQLHKFNHPAILIK
jgi:hypothetical protein